MKYIKIKLFTLPTRFFIIMGHFPLKKSIAKLLLLHSSFHFRSSKARCFSRLNQIVNFHEKALFLCISYGPRSEKLLKKWTLEIGGGPFY